jgi:hypothetical protein
MLTTSTTTSYIKRFLRTKHGILFKLNDQCVQLILIDGSEIILDSPNRRVMFINYKKQVTLIPLKEALDRQKYPEDHDITKRLLYMKKAMSLIETIGIQKKKTVRLIKVNPKPTPNTRNHEPLNQVKQISFGNNNAKENDCQESKQRRLLASQS